MTEMAFCAHIGRLETTVDPSSSTILDQIPAGVVTWLRLVNIWLGAGRYASSADAEQLLRLAREISSASHNLVYESKQVTRQKPGASTFGFPADINTASC